MGVQGIYSQQWAAHAADLKAGHVSKMNVGALVQWALRQAYLQNVEDMHYFAEKVRFNTALKRSIREELTRLRKVRATLTPHYQDNGSVNLTGLQQTQPPDHTAPNGTDYRQDATHPNWGSSADGVGGARRWVDEQLRSSWGGGGGVKTFLETPGLDGDVQSSMSTELDNWWGIGGKEKLDSAIDELESKLESAAEIGQLENVTLQQNLQRMQQTLQMLTNVAKTLHEGCMAVVRNLK